MENKHLTAENAPPSATGTGNDQAPPGYKRTEVGVIPEGWELRSLSDVVEFLDAQRRPVKSSDRAKMTGIYPYYGATGIVDYVNDYLFDDELILLGEDGENILSRNMRLVFRVSGKVWVNNHAHVLRPKNGVAIGYLAEYLESLDYREYNSGTAQPKLNRQTCQKIPVAVPPLSEQRAIAEALSDVDGLIGALDKLITKKRAIKLAAMQQLLTGKTRLPGFHGAWETKRIGDICTFLPTASNPRADLGEHGDVEYIHYGDIHAHSQPVIDCSLSSLPRIEKDRIGNAAQLQEGDLVLVDASEDLVGVGKSVEVQGVASRTVVAGLHTILLRGNPDHWAVRFKAYLQFIPAFKTALMRAATGISVYAISKRQLADVVLPLPTIHEQKAIVAILADIDTEIEALEQRRDKTRQIKQGMMQQLLTGKIRLVKPRASAGQAEPEKKATRKHSTTFNEAVVIATLVRRFGKEEFPLGRMRYTKLCYLLHRKTGGQIEGYLKKAAGPYNPKTRYGGPERIALENGYIREHQSGAYSGFVAADNIAQAENYFETWYGAACLEWLEQFRYTKKDELELLTTVDMAAEELRAAGKQVDVVGVKSVLRHHPEWQAKLDRPIFSDANISRAIEKSHELFSDNLGGAR